MMTIFLYDDVITACSLIIVFVVLHRPTHLHHHPAAFGPGSLHGLVILRLQRKQIAQPSPLFKAQRGGEAGLLLKHLSRAVLALQF